MNTYFKFLAPGLFLLASFQSMEIHAQGSDPSLGQRVMQLERALQEMQDVESIKKLMRAYGYYLDKRLWDQVLEVFSKEGSFEIVGRGTYKGHESLKNLFYGDMGRGIMGLKQGSINNHLILQGVVNVNPDGRTAKGRWRTFTLTAQYQESALWGAGVYENEYVKQEGVWLINKIRYYATYVIPYDEGPKNTGLPMRDLSEEFPPDEISAVELDVYPGIYVPPFHYPNPGSGEIWKQEDTDRYTQQRH